MGYKLFIDDERYPFEDNFVIARNFDEVVQLVEKRGFPSLIYFDHDLGNQEKTGYDIAKWLIEQDIELDWWTNVQNFEFYVHSQNPVGKKNIEELFASYKRSKFKM